MYTYKHTRIHTHVNRYKWHIYKHTHPHVHSHAIHTHTHTHTNTYTYIHANSEGVMQMSYKYKPMRFLSHTSGTSNWTVSLINIFRRRVCDEIVLRHLYVNAICVSIERNSQCVQFHWLFFYFSTFLFVIMRLVLFLNYSLIYDIYLF